MLSYKLFSFTENVIFKCHFNPHMSADVKPVHSQCVGIGQVRIHLLKNLVVISEYNVQFSISDFKAN
jgi:hypothetical protein